IGKTPVAMDFVEVGEKFLYVIQGMRALGVSGQQHAPPRILSGTGGVMVDTLQLLPQAVDFFASRNRIRFSLEFGNLPLNLAREAAFSAGWHHGLCLKVYRLALKVPRVICGKMPAAIVQRFQACFRISTASSPQRLRKRDRSSPSAFTAR